MTHHCHTCRQPIPAGLAHLRSVNFELVAYCGPCFDLERAFVAPAVAPVPVQRRGGSLAERLASAEAERMSA